ncbi:unnamed protein product [Psylliodes chrysocephalus]|uniref:Uncharacterized protein n=1 Tax=Psylliodes chrysocephalus TaxID=3402493 RepID=A0A9P0GMD7_9CUCU|nr:unnamed protein product [Psylliodes chrysocephala]
MMDSKRALTMQELEDIFNDPNFIIDEDSPNLDIVVLTPDPDYVTDEDEVEDDELGIAEIKNVPGQLLELQFYNEDNEVDNVPLPSTTAYIGRVPIKKKKIEDTSKIFQYIPKDFLQFFEEKLTWPTAEGDGNGDEED